MFGAVDQVGHVAGYVRNAVRCDGRWLVDTNERPLEEVL